MSADQAKERNAHSVAIVVAIIGALATITAALIAVAPKSEPALPKAENQPLEPRQPPAQPPFVARTGDCVGKWRWRTANRSINFDLNNDGTFLAEDFPDKNFDGGGFGVVRQGKGHWSVDDGTLTVTMTHVWAVAFWKDQAVTWINRARVKSAAAAEVELEGESPLRRRQ